MVDFFTDPTKFRSSSPDNSTITPPITAGSNSLYYKNRARDTISSAYDFKNYHYPRDLLGADNTYGGNYVVFYINVQQESRLGVNGGDVGDTIADNISASSSGLRSDVKNEKTGALGIFEAGAIGGIVGGLSGVTYGPAGVAAGAASGSMGNIITAELSSPILNQAKTTSRATKRLKAAIALHNPNQLSTSYNINWSGEDLTKESMLANKFGDGGDNRMSIVATVLAMQMLPNRNLLSAQTGQATNPKKEMLFNGVEFRSFTFDYKFAPRNQDELILVQNIIKMFKFHMHPEYVPNMGNYLYLYPSEFDIVYYADNGNENMNLPRVTSCVLASMNVTYTPNNNFTAFKGGAPTEVGMTLQFMELAKLTKENISDGY